MNLKLLVSTAILSRIFAIFGLLNHGRATHLWGVAAAGTFKVSDSADLPAHDFFKKGNEYPIQLRHANVSFEDDACKGVRSGSLKFSHQSDDSPLDLLMNTGEGNGFWNIKTFISFTWARIRGEKGFKSYCDKYPEACQVARGSVRRAPDSFSQLRYYSKIPFHFHTQDGKILLVKFKLGPYEKVPDSGLVTGDDYINVWQQQRLPEETRDMDYLRKEFLSRISEKEIKYRLSMQLHTPISGESEEIYNAAQAWDENTHPWIELGVATFSKSLSTTQAELLQFQVNNMPDSISVIPAKSMSDYNSIGYARSKVYKYAQNWRLKFYKYRHRVGPIASTKSD
ncbi:MAG: catalase [Gammaproteobacteria bacterium]|nr:catalase [Gammaproteobacteria bacterium]